MLPQVREALFQRPGTHALFVIKPHVCRAAAPTIIKTLFHELPEDTQILAMKDAVMSVDVIRRHYAHCTRAAFFSEVLAAMTMAPSLGFWLHSTDYKLCMHLKHVLGPTDPAAAAYWQLRAKYGVDKTRNGFHCSGTPAEGQKEIRNWFREE